MGGSAYSNGRIEFVISRLGKSVDIFGTTEVPLDWSPNHNGINFTGTFKLAWTNNIETLFKLIQKEHIMQMSH